MGFTRKSWLAMVLAIVMVLGMAMPTAFAAPVLGNLKFSVNDGAAAVTDYTMSMGDKPVDIKLWNNGVGAPNDMLTEAFLEQKPVVTIEDVDPAIGVEVKDGLLTVTAKDLTDAAGVTFFVKVEHQAGKPWTNPGWVTGGLTDLYYEGTFTVIVKPTATYKPTSITMDMANSTRSAYVDTSAFTASPAGTLKLPNAVVTPASAASVTKVNDTLWLVVADAAGEATLTFFNYTVDGVESLYDKRVNIPLHISNSTTGVASKVVPSVTGISVKRNAEAKDYSFKLATKDAQGNGVNPAPVAFPDQLFRVSFVADSADSVVVYGTPVGALATPLPAGDFNTTGQINISLHANLISAKGTMTVGHAGMLETSFPYEIKPLELNTGLATNAVKIDLDKSKLATDPVKTAYVYFTSADATASATLAVSAGDIVIKDDKGVVKTALFNVGVASNKLTLTSNGAPKGTYTLSVVGKVGTLYTEYKKITVNVVDNTPVPTVTAVAPAVALDIQATSTTKQAEVVLTAANFIDQIGQPNGNTTAGKGLITISSVAFNPALNATAELQDGASAAFTTASIVATEANSNAKFTIKGVKRYTGKMTIKGMVNGIAFSDVVVDINIDDKTPNQPHHYVVAPAGDVTKKLTETKYEFDVQLVDFAGNQIVSTIGTVPVVSGTPAVADFSNPKDINGKAVLTFVDKGTTTVTVGNTTTYPTAPVVTFKVTVTPPVFTTNPAASFVFDRKSDDDSKVVISLASTDGALSSVSASTPNADVAAPTYDATKKELTVKLSNRLTATNAKRQKLTINAKVNNYDAAPVVLDFEIKNTLTLNSTPATLAYEMRDGGLKDGTIVIGANGTAVVTSITAVPADVLTITNTSALNYKVVANKAGKGMITVKGTVNGVPVDDLTIPFTVLAANEKPAITATPSGDLNFDLKTGGKFEETLTFKSDFGTLTDVKVVSANTAIATVSTAAPWKVTGKSIGSTELTVTAKIGALECEPLKIAVKVVNSSIPAVAGLILDGATTLGKTATIYLMGDGSADPLNVHSIVLNDATGNPVTGQVTWSTQYSSIIAVDKTNVATSKLTVKKTGTVTIKAKDVAANKTYSVKFTVKYAPATGITQISPFDMLVGERITLKPQLAPAGARVRGFTYSSNKKSVATVNTSGAVSAKGAGEAVITIRNKAKTSMKIQVTITVKNDPTLINYKAAYLMINENGKANAAEADLKAIFEAASYKAGNTSTAAKIDGTSKTTVLAGLAPFQGAASGIGAHDVFTFFYSGPATKTGLTIGAETLSYADLAAELAKINGNIVVMLDCTGGNRMINTKSAEDDAAINANIIGAFAKASVKSGMTSIGYAGGKTKFNVLTATKTKSQTSRIVAGSETATDMSKIFSKALVDCLKKTDGKMLADKDSNSYVTMSELYSKVKSLVYSASKKKMSVGVWPTTPTKMPVYASVNVAAPVTP